MTNSADAIAAFLAKGGSISKVAPDATCGRDLRNAARDAGPVVTVLDDAEIPGALALHFVCNFVIRKGVSVLGMQRNVGRHFRDLETRFKNDEEPNLSAYAFEVKKLIARALERLVDGFTYFEAEHCLKMDQDQFDHVNAMYRACTFRPLI